MTATMIAKGLLTFVVPKSLYNTRPTETVSARYCYAVFMRHLIKVHAATGRAPLGNVAELGPGGSLGTGLAAMIAGARRYFAVDARRHSQRESNLKVFDELIELFRSRSVIPDSDEIPQIKPALADYRFPAHILDDSHMNAALEPARLAQCRRAIDAESFDGDSPIVYAAPWYDTALVPPGSIDWIFSQAVLEHVDDVALVYATCQAWLAPGGLMSHQIDLRSHGTAATWDGHRAYSDFAWRVIRGARAYLINRAPLSRHLELARQAGFELLATDVVRTPPTLARQNLAPDFRGCSDDDLAASGVFVVHRKASER
jgi:hypothetical protein